MLTEQSLVDTTLEEFGIEVIPDDQLYGIHWEPFKDSPQELAYHCQADELFFGGAAGGGKTDLLLGLAGTAHTRSLLMRRVFPSVRGMIERSREIYNSFHLDHAKDSYNESLHIWRLGSGRIVEFGSLVHSRKLQDYRGRPYDLYGFDEITEFTEEMYRFLTAWNRSADPEQRCRIVCTGNPPSDVEGEWVTQYWGAWLDPDHPNPAEPGELRWYMTINGEDVEMPDDAPVQLDNGEWVQPRSRTFIPAFLQDNPILMESGYMSTINALPEPLRSQLLYGDFSIRSSDDEWQVIPSQAVLDAQRRWREGDKPDLALGAVGLDCARGGDDDNVAAKLYGSWFDPLLVKAGRETPRGWHVSQWVLSAMETDAMIGVDAVGNGAGVVDALENAGAELLEIVASQKATAKDPTGRYGYDNLRAQMWWEFRLALLDPKERICLPDDRELRVELCAPRYRVRNGKYVIESKPDVKKRLGRSTDRADAVIQAWYTAKYGSIGGEVYVW